MIFLKTHFKYIFILVFLFFLVATKIFASESGLIVAKINNNIITFSNLVDRYNFIISESKIKINSSEERRILINQIIDKMIDEELIRQEGERLHINVSEEEVDSVIESFAVHQKKTVAILKKSFLAKGLSYSSYRNQIKVDLIWSQIIANSVKSRIKITDSEIKEYLEQKKIKY